MVLFYILMFILCSTMAGRAIKEKLYDVAGFQISLAVINLLTILKYLFGI